MIKQIIPMIALIISGCVSYVDSDSEQLGSCLSVHDSRGNDSTIKDEEIINFLNKSSDKTITNIITNNNGTLYSKNNSSACSVSVHYNDGTKTSRVLFLRGNNTAHPEFNLYTRAEFEQQRQLIVQKDKQEQDKIDEKRQENKSFSIKEFKSASVTEYPYIAKAYCYNKKTLALYTPESCDIYLDALGSKGVGPGNYFVDNKESANFMLKENFNFVLSMSEENPFLGMKVDIRSRKTNEVLSTHTGSYTDSVFVSN
ncbi:hypothetical protein [Enterobacter ludwigii]|uniref:hypothetical protein n=1 Tax=Enterobacter TaxID=547 RepID=UPI003BEEB32A